MWKCCHCGMDVMFHAAEPEVDDRGYYFICPECGARNDLTNVGGPGPDDSIALVQPGD